MNAIVLYQHLREEMLSEGVAMPEWNSLDPAHQIAYGKLYRTLQRERHMFPKWRCFHCDEEFANPNLARAHFGNGPEAKPACIQVQERGMLYELREAQQKVTELTAKVEQLEYQVNGHEATIASRFKGVRSVDEAWHMYDSMEGRALAAEKALAVIQSFSDIQIWRNQNGNWSVTVEDDPKSIKESDSLIEAIILQEQK